MSDRDRELLASVKGVPAADVRLYWRGTEQEFQEALRAISQARMEEREAVVRWLRGKIPNRTRNDYESGEGRAYENAADTIETGDHLPTLVLDSGKAQQPPRRERE